MLKCHDCIAPSEYGNTLMTAPVSRFSISPFMGFHSAFRSASWQITAPIVFRIFFACGSSYATMPYCPSCTGFMAASESSIAQMSSVLPKSLGMAMSPVRYFRLKTLRPSERRTMRPHPNIGFQMYFVWKSSR